MVENSTRSKAHTVRGTRLTAPPAWNRGSLSRSPPRMQEDPWRPDEGDYREKGLSTKEVLGGGFRTEARRRVRPDHSRSAWRRPSRDAWRRRGDAGVRVLSPATGVRDADPCAGDVVPSIGFHRPETAYSPVGPPPALRHDREPGRFRNGAHRHTPLSPDPGRARFKGINVEPVAFAQGNAWNRHISSHSRHGGLGSTWHFVCFFSRRSPERGLRPGMEPGREKYPKGDCHETGPTSDTKTGRQESHGWNGPGPEARRPGRGPRAAG
jgi:hypothetical protein